MRNTMVYYLKHGFDHLKEGERQHLLLPPRDGPGRRQAEDGLRALPRQGGRHRSGDRRRDGAPRAHPAPRLRRPRGRVVGAGADRGKRRGRSGGRCPARGRCGLGRHLRRAHGGEPGGGAVLEVGLWRLVGDDGRRSSRQAAPIGARSSPVLGRDGRTGRRDAVGDPPPRRDEDGGRVRDSPPRGSCST